MKKKIFFFDGFLFSKEKYGDRKKNSKETSWNSKSVVTSKIKVENMLILISKSDFKAKFSKA